LCVGTPTFIGDWQRAMHRMVCHVVASLIAGDFA
jgi:hypothetical protein